MTDLRNHLSHFDASGQAHMVDVSDKPDTLRIATAQGEMHILPATFALIKAGDSKKGDVLGIARTAAIMASKKTSELIPLCHPIFLSKVSIEFTLDEANTRVICTATCHSTGKTGVEMEALTAVNVALLTIYDMCKAVDKGMTMQNIQLLEKQGGKSGHWVKTL